MKQICRFLLFLCLCRVAAYAQTAEVGGTVQDPSNAVVAQATVEFRNQATGVQHQVTTNNNGIYHIVGLEPGKYDATIQAKGFKTLSREDIVFEVAARAQIDFQLEVGSGAETITVNGSGMEINTTDASVSTVIDRQFVENLPLNGRSFQSLLYITPGVSLNVGAGPSNTNQNSSPGQFVVNGQRADTNYWMIDGVSANIGVTGFTASSGLAGAVGATNALGGTSALVSVDALQEFRIETSSYAPEYGREPGGQISIQTRSGTNQFHGDLFEYLRNSDLDATDWFADHYGLPKAAEIQNDFGGVVGGPILKDKTFFFFSAEALRLILPATFIGTVPDMAARQAATAPNRPYMDSFPTPQAGSQAVPGYPGLVTYNATFSQPDAADAYSLRLDHQLIKNLSLFARFSYAPSNGVQRGSDGNAANSLFANKEVTKTGTAGVTWTKSAQIVDDARFNYSVAGGTATYVADNYGGGTNINFAQSLFASPYTYQDANFQYLPTFGLNMFEEAGAAGGNYQHQLNIVDTLSVLKGAHSLKFGVDYRRMTPYHAFTDYLIAPLFADLPSLQTGFSDLTITYHTAPGTFLLHNLGLYGQDTWRINSRLNLTYGLRWDVDFRPAVENQPDFPAVTGFSTTNLANLALAPLGTPPYNTRYDGIQPRIGGAYRLLTDADWGLVLRGGFGVFNGLNSTELGNGGLLADYPFAAEGLFSNVAFPTTPTVAAAPPIVVPTIQNQEQVFAFDPHLDLPYALEWNIALEQSIGRPQAFTLSYIGASDKRQLETESITNPNSRYASVNLIGNTGSLNYQALQAQFQRRLANGLQALASYTWAHAIDNGSYGAYSNGTLANANANRGPADYDLRGVFSAAVTYNSPEWKKNLITKALTGGWSTDDVVQIRSGPPLDIDDGNFTALSHENASILIRPDVVPGQPEYLTGSQYPGRKALNPAGFADPPVDPTTHLPLRQGDLSRNGRRALPLKQWDFAAHREFPIYERLKLQFRAELFNVLNHPNFGPYNNNFQNGNFSFGQSTSMLNQYLGGLQGSGTQNPLYAPGGTRSGEMALKLIF